MIATKFGIVRSLVSGEGPMMNGRPEYVRERIERSLGRLGTLHVSRLEENTAAAGLARNGR